MSHVHEDQGELLIHRRATIETDDTKADLAEAFERENRLEIKVIELERRNDELRTLWAQADASAKQFESALQQTLRELAVAESHLKKKQDVEEHLNSVARALGVAEQRANSAKVRAENEGKEVEALRNRIEILLKELSESKRQNALLEAEITGLREDVADLTAEQEILVSQAQNLQKELTEVNMKNEKIISDTNAARYQSLAAQLEAEKERNHYLHTIRTLQAEKSLLIENLRQGGRIGDEVITTEMPKSPLKRSGMAVLALALSSMLFTANGCSKEDRWVIGEPNPYRSLAVKLNSKYKRSLEKNNYSLYYSYEKPDRIVLKVRYRDPSSLPKLQTIVQSAKRVVTKTAKEAYGVTVSTAVDMQPIPREENQD